MAYTLSTSLKRVRGIGAVTADKLAQHGIETIGDFLLAAPLRYEDRSSIYTISQLLTQPPADKKAQVTVLARVVSTSTFRKGNRSFQSAKLQDATGSIKAAWFNSPFILTSLHQDETYLFAGTYSSQYKNLTQPAFEKVTDQDPIHTGRLVPFYSSIFGLKPGNWRRILSNIFAQLSNVPEVVSTETGAVHDSNPPPTAKKQAATSPDVAIPGPDLITALNQLHFPDSAEQIIQARERLALEELLVLQQRSHELKQQFVNQATAPAIHLSTAQKQQLALAPQLPFSLTASQTRAITAILEDLQRTQPMNRLLLGEVGSGKTVVAGIAANTCIAAGQHVCLIAPTRVLATQHALSLQQLFPHVPISLVLSGSTVKPSSTATLFIGTQALYNHLPHMKPALIVLDEQQRFGVLQRTEQIGWTSESSGTVLPHVLTMTATPIPRSLALVLFGHLAISELTDLPFTRNVSTLLEPVTKQPKAVAWLNTQLTQPNTLLLVVCPAIDPNVKDTRNTAAATEMFELMRQYFPNQSVGLLHGRLTKKEQQAVLEALTARAISILVCTSIVEVGVDLPQATHLWIEDAERFGLSSLHQLRGRVGRRGQQGYCLLWTKSQDTTVKKRLSFFATHAVGSEVAEYDLNSRGAGDIFGTKQHGWAALRFASWTNTAVITQAVTVYQALPQSWNSALQQSFLKQSLEIATN